MLLRCWIPCVFLDADFFRDREGEDNDQAHDEESESLVGVPVIRHLSVSGPRYRLVQRDAHWGEKKQGSVWVEDELSAVTQGHYLRKRRSKSCKVLYDWQNPKTTGRISRDLNNKNLPRECAESISSLRIPQ